MRLALAFAVLASLASCAEFPALEGTISPEQANAPYPALVPLTPLIAQVGASQSGAENTQSELAPRVAALRARAADLRGPVIPPAERARMLRGVR